MHYHLEIIMPPTEDVEAAIAQILKPFDENGSDEDGNLNLHPFWDFWIIGGRWAGEKLKAGLDQEQLKKFYDKLKEIKITVHGVQCGKQELAPASQIPDVDAVWCEFFPESNTKVCPLFNHYNDQYKNSDGYPDVMTFDKMPDGLTAERVIIAAPDYEDTLNATFMIQQESWNGVTHIKADWDGKIKTAIEWHLKRLENYEGEYKRKSTPQDDWLVVTVDYHS